MARGSISKRCPCGTTGIAGRPACKQRHGTWGFVVPVGTTANGNPRQKRQGGYSSRDEAEAALRAELARIDAGTWVDDRGITLAEWMKIWLERCEAAGLEVKTLAGYRTSSAEWTERLGKIRLRDLRRKHINAALEQMRAQPELTKGRRIRGGQRSNGTLDAKRRALRTALAEAMRDGLISTNHAEGRLTAIGRGRSVGLTIWEPDQLRTYLNRARAHEDLYPALLTAAFTGLRRGEVMGSVWSGIDDGWETAEWAGLTVSRTLIEPGRTAIPPALRTCHVCGQEHRGLLWKARPKSRAGERWVPLVHDVRQALADHRERQRKTITALGGRYLDHGLIFASVDGRPRRPSDLSDLHDHLVAMAPALPPLHLHMLRHSACSLMLAGGMPIDVVQMVMGHASPAITRQVYAHLQRGPVAHAMERAMLGVQHRRDQSVTSPLRLVQGGR